MKIWLKIIISLIVSLISGTIFIPEVLGAAKFSNIKVSEIENGSAKIEWRTDVETKGTVYYGEKAADLNKKMGYSLFDYDHDLIITGLKKNKTYLFKIVAIDGTKVPQETESFLQTFSTKNMKKEEIVPPNITEAKVIEVSSGAMVLGWRTNEKTKATIYFREETEKSYRSSDYAKFDYYHRKVIAGLKPGKRYNIKIVAVDASGNKATKYLLTNIRTGITPALQILDIEPLSNDENLVLPTNITIKWRTGRVTNGVISYGTNFNLLSNIVRDPSSERKLKHEVKITGLEPGKNYFYKITATDSFSNKVSSKVMSFTTPLPRKELVSGSIVKDGSYRVFVIEGSTKRWIKTADIFLKLGYKWEWIKKVEDYLLNDYKEAPALASAIKHPNGTLVKYANSPVVYLLENGKKRPFSSVESFSGRGFDWSRIITISKNEKYKTGEYL